MSWAKPRAWRGLWALNHGGGFDGGRGCGLPPSYEQKAFPIEERRGQLRLVAAPKGRDGTVAVHQDARLFIANLQSGERVTHESEPGRGAWLQLARGIVALNGTERREGDGAAVEGEPAIVVEADTDAEFLLFDLR